MQPICTKETFVSAIPQISQSENEAVYPRPITNDETNIQSTSLPEVYKTSQRKVNHSRTL